MKNILYILILLLFSVQASGQNEDMEDLEDFRKKQSSELEFDKEDMVDIPEMDIRMAPPEGFEFHDSLNGFVHKGSSASIQILEIENVGMKNATESLTQEYFKQQGFQLEKESVLQLNNGKKAKIYVTDYTVKDENYQRIFFFTGNKNTIWINVNYPMIVKDLIYKPIIASLKTVTKK
ncbi:MAG: hypothetical protein R6V32_11170 [Bacteroidales bacterium]